MVLADLTEIVKNNYNTKTKTAAFYKPTLSCAKQNTVAAAKPTACPTCTVCSMEEKIRGPKERKKKRMLCMGEKEENIVPEAEQKPTKWRWSYTDFGGVVKLYAGTQCVRVSSCDSVCRCILMKTYIHRKYTVDIDRIQICTKDKKREQ